MEESIEQSGEKEGEISSKGNIREDDCEDDVWGDDSDEILDSGSSLSREWNWRQNRFHTIGYREGITEGKEASAQEGFNIGFRQSVRVGKKWGLVRGITSAITSLPENLAEKLVPNIEARERLKGIQNDVQAISSENARKIYHEIIQKNDSLQSMDGEDHSEEVFRLKNELESQYKELGQVLSDCPEIKVGEILGIGNTSE